jgi:Skp family chaperone for outer membrane proteins
MRVVQSIGDKEKYMMIIDRNITPVAYGAEANDLTMQVIEEFNRTYEAPK